MRLGYSVGLHYNEALSNVNLNDVFYLSTLVAKSDLCLVCAQELTNPYLIVSPAVSLHLCRVCLLLPKSCKKGPLILVDERYLILQWAVLDSNQRPLRCQRNALTS